jgi:hypothetical protein
MKRVIAIGTATILTLLVALTLSVAAQQPDTRDRTIMTFSGPVELPGMRLERGTYVFRLADTALRNVIQVLSADEKEMLGQWLFVSAERPDVSGDTVVTFRETSAASTPAVQFWYYPGEKIGKEFIYPKDQALRIAQRTGTTVLTDEGRIGASGQASITAEAQPSSAEVSISSEPEQASISSEPEQVAVAVETQDSAVVIGSGLPEETQVEAVGTSGIADDQTSQTSAAGRQESTDARNDAELPRTASPLPLSGLIALLSLAGAAGIRAFRL